MDKPTARMMPRRRFILNQIMIKVDQVMIKVDQVMIKVDQV